MTPPPLLQVCIRKVDSPHRSKPVLADIELQIRRGEFVLLSGPSESGKSALCRCLAGIIPLFADSILDGDIVFEGQPLRKLRLPELTGKIGYVHNDPDNQLFCTTLEEDLAFGPCSMLLAREEVNRRVQWAMHFVGLSGFGKRTPLTLSGGEKQRAALASILSLEPAVLILDRSIDQLDLQGRQDIYRKLKQRCKKDGTAVILVDERLNDIQHLADRIVILEDGSLSFVGAPSQGLKKYFSNSRPRSSSLTPSMKAPYSKTMGPIHILDRHNNQPQPGPVSLTSDAANKSSRSASIISLRDVYYQYSSSLFALQRVSLEIGQGEFLALVGSNGAGKTTLAKHINGLLPPQKGDVRVYSLNTRSATPAELAQYVGTCFQDPTVRVSANTVREEVGFALKLKKIPKSELDDRVSGILEQLGLVSVGQQHPYRLSPSQLQCVTIASVLVSNPRILILDEPTSRFSQEKKWQVMELIKEFHQTGATIIMISHDPDAVLNFSERIVTLEKGQILLDGSAAQLRSSERDLFDILHGPDPRALDCTLTFYKQQSERNPI